jgi:gliding motility-associated-like protein
MKYKLLFVILSMYFSSYGQDFQWVRQIKGLEDKTETASFIEVDNNGNTYTLGKSYSIEYDIDPTLNGVQLINNQNSSVSNPEDIYLIKLNTNGDFIWGRTLSVLKDDESVLGLKFDSQGNIYVLAFITELYQNQTQINGYGFINVIKIDPNGNEVYRRKIQNQGNLNAGKIYAISSFDIDSSDNIYITGAFQHTVLLDNNPQNNLVANGNSMYVLKLNQNGDILWAKNLNYNISGKVSLNIDSNNEINLLFNCFNNTNNGHSLNILKLNNFNANQIWLKTIEDAFLSNVAIDSNNNFVITGIASNSVIVDLNPNPNISNVAQNNSFVLFFDSNGNYYDSKLFDLNISFSAIEIDNLNGYHFGGSFKNSNIDFDPSLDYYYMSSLGFDNNGYYNDGFYLKLNSNRDFAQASIIGTPPFNNGTCYSSHINSIKTFNENIYIAGEFAGNCDLDPTLLSSYLLNSFNNNVINSDGFILKLGNCDILPPSGDTSQIFCSSENLTIKNLTPNSSSIKWYDSATSTIQLSNNTTLINGQTYYASKQVGSCPESQQLAVAVRINQTPTPPIASNQTFCQSENALISNIIITGQNINWYDSLTAINLLPNSTILKNTTTYYATQTINNCESERTPVSISITTEQLPSATSHQTLCIQQSATLSEISITGQNIKWYNSLTNGTLLSNTTPLQNGTTYYASQTISGCESERIPVLINIQNTPAPIGNTNQTLCSSQNPTLENIVISGNAIKWYNSAGILLSNSTSLQDGVTYYASQTENNCESPNKLAITISLINTLPANNYEELFCDDLNDGSEKVNLSVYDSKLISNTSGYTFSYYSTFLGAENQLADNQITNFSNYNLALGENKIYVRINSNTPCYAIVELKLTLVSKPIISIPDVVPICENNSITIDAGLGFDTYLWSTGATTSSIVVANPGNYSVTATTNYSTISCSSTKNFEVRKSNVATITSVETQDWTDNQNTITVFASGTGDFEYSIDGIHFQDSNQFSALFSGEYTVHVRDKNGCGTATDEVFLLMYPKYFTPNGDGFNDTWNIKFSDLETNLSIKIFDRYGKLIKELIQNNDWNGTLNGYELPSDDYWFVINRADGKEYKGHFSLKR